MVAFRPLAIFLTMVPIFHTVSPAPIVMKPKILIAFLVKSPLITMAKGVPDPIVETAQHIVNLINNQSDVLPDYELRLHVAPVNDETFPEQFLLNFTDHYRDLYLRATTQRDNNARYGNVYMSPLIIAPMINQFASLFCAPISYVAQFTNTVALAPCDPSDQFKRDNTFTVEPSQNAKVFGLIRFIKEVGHWRRIAVLAVHQGILSLSSMRSIFISFAASPPTYQFAVDFQNLAPTHGLEIVWFDVMAIGNDNVKEQIISLKRSDARIILTFISDPNDLANFFCEAYLAGIKGKRYVFLALGTGFIPQEINYRDPSKPDCNRKIFEEQYISTIWIDGLNEGFQLKDDTNRRPMFNNDKEAGDFLESYFSNQKARPFQNIYLQSFLTLHVAEKKLRKLNSSLSNYFTEKDVVSDAIKETIKATTFRSVGSYLWQYDNTGNVASPPQFVVRWNGSQAYKLGLVAYNHTVSDSSAKSYDSYYLLMNSIDNTWLTVDKMPPRDSSISMTLTIDVSYMAAIPVTLMIAVALVSHIAEGVIVFKFRHIVDPQNTPEIKSIGFAGCVALNAAGIAFALPLHDHDPAIVWNIRIILLICGFAVINGVIFLRMALFFHVTLQKTKHPAFRRGQADSSTERSHGQIRRFMRKATVRSLYYDAEKQVLKLLAAWIIVQTAVVSAWLAVDPLHCFSEHLKHHYDEESDIMFEVKAISCYNRKNSIAWPIAFVVINLAPLAQACNWSLHLRRMSNVLHSELVIAKIATFMVTSAEFCAVLILYLLNDNIINVQVAVAATAFLLTTVVGISWFYWILRFTFKKKKHFKATVRSTKKAGVSSE